MTQEELIEEVARTIHDTDDISDTVWPDSEDDNGYRGGDGWVRLCQNPESYRLAARKVIRIVSAALKEEDRVKSNPEFEPGELAQWIVGLPGPDLDNCTVVSRNEDGTYFVKFQVYGSGPWHEDLAFPNQYCIGGLFKLK